MPYESLPHTADIALRITARTLPGLFDEATRAFVASFTDATRVAAAEGRLVTVASADLDTLFHDYLAELLFVFETGRWLPRSSDAWLDTHDGVWRLDAHLLGEAFDPERHPVTTAIKAVTYHGLSVARAGDGWEADVVLDI